jgi:hypothetical protein
MSNCKHFPDADDHCVICEAEDKAKAKVMELHLLTINTPGDEVEFPAGGAQVFADAQELQKYVDYYHPLWTSLVIVALPHKSV